MLKRLKEMRDNKKGFTLVELIVVLVILAILAALLIPALTGYIDKAKEKQIVAETRQVVMAAQTLVDEQYAALDSGKVVFTTDDSKKGTDNGLTGTAKEVYVTAEEIAKLAEVDKANFNSTNDNIQINDGVVTKVEYTSGGKNCTYTYDTTKNEGKYETN